MKCGMYRSAETEPFHFRAAVGLWELSFGVADARLRKAERQRAVMCAELREPLRAIHITFLRFCMLMAREIFLVKIMFR
jgi:hypothetical protein